MATATELLAAFKNVLGAKNYGANYSQPVAKPKDTFNAPFPSLKGMYTGFQPQRDVDLNQGFGIGTEPPFAEKPKTDEFKPETRSATEDFLNAIVDPRYRKFREEEEQRTTRSNQEQAAFAQQIFQSYIPAMERLATKTRLTDYQLGLLADIQSPTRQSERAARAQQQMATAAGAEAGMLGAVNEAAYRNAMANIAGLQSGMRRG